MLKILLKGKSGKMGQAVCQLVDSKQDFEIISEPQGTPNEVLLDFSSCDALQANLDLAQSHKLHAVIATTGHLQSNLDLLQEAARNIPVLFAPNTSLGANLLYNLSATAAKALPDFDTSVLDIHHNQKRDNPSGTALKLQEVIDSNRGSPATHAHGIRGGNVQGEHTAFFLGENEQLRLTHQVTSRAVFAQGALKAVQFLAGKEAGLYHMTHVLGLEI